MMHARVATFQGPPQRVDELTHTFETRVRPAIQHMSGFQFVYWLVDREAGEAVSVSLWESEAAVLESDPRGERLRALCEPFGFRVVKVARYDVAGQG